MDGNKRGVCTFCEGWVAELTRAIEMFAGEQAEVTWALPDQTAHQQESLDDYLWWKQDFDLEGSVTIWVGAPEATWAAIGSALGTSADGGRQIYLEMLSQSLQGAAHVLGPQLRKPMKCCEGQEGAAPSLDSFELVEVAITLRGKQLPRVIAAIDHTIARALAPETSVAETPMRGTERQATPGPDVGSLLDRLIDLELPMSVALGRAVLPIREVLKLTSGSLVELDHHVGDSVEVLVHGTVVARGEVVSAKGNYAVRIQEVISRQDRMALRPQQRVRAHIAAAD